MRRGVYWMLGAVGLGVALVLWLNLVCRHRATFGAVSDFFCGQARPDSRAPGPPR